MSSTFVACLTPPGSAALATLGLCGPDAWAILQHTFRPSGSGKLPMAPEPNRFWFGKLGDATGRDEVVVAVKAVTPVCHVEVHCHGGRQAVAFLEEVFAERGARRCCWQELLGQRGEPGWRIAAREALGRAVTVRTASILLDQYHGVCVRALAEASGHLKAGRLAEGREVVEKLSERVRLGRHLVEPWRVALAGAPNVGKSSLGNALAGYARSVVSALPGTTRDVVTTRVAIDGWPVELADTAGQRDGHDDLERAGIERARAVFAQADLVLWIVDGAAAPVLPQMPSSVRAVFVINKVDLPTGWNHEEVVGAVRVSARTGAGIAGLCERISKELVPEVPAAGEAVPYTDAMCENIERAGRALACGGVEEALGLLRCRVGAIAGSFE